MGHAKISSRLRFSISKFFNSPLNAGTPPCPLKMNLQISLGKTNALESHKSGISMGKEWIGLTKDHGKVTSLVATKEHVTLRHAWHESKKSSEQCPEKNYSLNPYTVFFIRNWFIRNEY